MENCDSVSAKWTIRVRWIPAGIDPVHMLLEMIAVAISVHLCVVKKTVCMDHFVQKRLLYIGIASVLKEGRR